MENNVQEKRITLRESFLPPFYFVILIWLIHIFQFITGADLGFYGIFPRESFGLRGILFAPLLHGDFMHLASNSVPFLVLSTMIIYFYPRVSLSVFAIIYFLTGLIVWLTARPVFHIGLSYVVYGLVSFVFWTGIFRRSVRSIVLSLIVMTLYSGMFLGILPTDDVISKNISWESHLAGAFVGILVAYFYKEEVEEEERLQAASFADEAPRYFFDRDVFDKTLTERQREEEQRRLEEEERRRNNPPTSGWFSDWT